MERVNKVEKLLTAPDQVLLWRFIIAKAEELLTNGYNARITIDFQNHRINSISSQDFIAGISQVSYHMQKIPLDE